MKYLKIMVLGLFLVGCSSHTSVSSKRNVEKLKPSWIMDKNGCKRWNPVPLKNETITWSGECVDRYVNGYGTLQWYQNGVSGSKYTGTMKKGKREGQGTVLFSNGDKESGNWSNGKRNGKFIVITKNGKSSEKYYKNGKIDESKQKELENKKDIEFKNKNQKAMQSLFGLRIGSTLNQIKYISGTFPSSGLISLGKNSIDLLKKHMKLPKDVEIYTVELYFSNKFTRHIQGNVYQDVMFGDKNPILWKIRFIMSSESHSFLENKFSKYLNNHGRTKFVTTSWETIAMIDNERINGKLWIQKHPFAGKTDIVLNYDDFLLSRVRELESRARKREKEKRKKEQNKRNKELNRKYQNMQIN